MELKPLRFDSTLEQYQRQAARSYDFRDWAALAEYVAAVTAERSPVYRFEAAVEAVIAGDAATLEALLREDPELVRARSMRVHRATLLHYVAANGVEGYRQKTPENAVEMATILLKAGAEVDALADMYGGQSTTMSMLVSSSPPAEAGVQVALVETLLNFGAAVERNGSPLMTALAFGHRSAAEALVRRGARVDHIATAAGLGRLADAARLLADADGESRHRALALAAQHGHTEIVRLLLDAGEDTDRYNPAGNHAHSTPLHQAALAGHEAVVRLLVERGARLDIKDTVYQGTALAWAEHAGQHGIAEFLRSRG
jgi:ankyrin repeat protein